MNSKNLKSGTCFALDGEVYLSISDWGYGGALIRRLDYEDIEPNDLFKVRSPPCFAELPKEIEITEVFPIHGGSHG